MSLFRNKYRIESARLAGWDYSAPGYYFVTICTHDRICNLSDIHDGVVCLSAIGMFVKEEWEKTASIRDNVKIHEYVIMPNHVHGIIQMTIPVMTTPTTTMATKTPQWKSGVLGAIVGQFKIQVTKQARRNGFRDFKWQPRFHDHVIRNERGLFRIRQYIRYNPFNWSKDKFNKM